ncbi:photosystem II repair protein Psb32 [Prochlorococcus marinus]|uniref:Beta-propeller domains of methanol dehydrogenase type n=1 Tax=Prochlorococcus marinus (strain MIT 9303) TaxID=59922 RepID=A2C9Q6_PROM3|nr:TPM domain-containing protein [Prochlorococcus marinus]ABM78216.1 Beta-propeller domains of methanol dehydrogenase type [Prochlorococcus marinus str. MIT 9303]
MPVLRSSRFLGVLISILLGLILLVPGAFAITTEDLPVARPEGHVVDSADVLSRVSRSQIEGRLVELGNERLDARLITLRKLDYGVSLSSFGSSLIDRWSTNAGEKELPLLVMLIDAQTKQTVVLADTSLRSTLPDALLQSTGRTTMNKPVVGGERYQQASFDAIARLQVVLDGGEDPGPPIEAFSAIKQTNIPSQEQTQSSNATLVVVVLMVVGTIVPMATWWVFSR